MDMSGMSMDGMDMSGMNMSGMNMSSMNMAGMSMASTSMATSTSTAGAAATSTAAAMDMGGMDMSGMDMSSMNMYFTTKFDDYALVFKTLKAKSPGAAFGIFCILFFSTFFLRGLSFLLFYLEQKVWKTENKNISIFIEDSVPIDNSSNDKFDEENPDPTSTNNQHIQISTATTKSKVTSAKIVVDNNCCNSRSVLAQIFFLPMHEIYRDIIRLILYFLIAMFSYAIMIAAMSYVVLYFFAICLGYAFGELFFNRLRIIYGVNPSTIEGSCHL